MIGKIALVILTLIFVIGPLSFGEDSGQKSEYRLQPMDVLHITVYGQPDLTTRARVTADGHISFPLIGKVEVTGLTVQELEKKIKDALEEKYLVSAQVLVFIEEYHPKQVSVIGEVTKPGKYDMPGEREITLLEAIAMAGGFTKTADPKNTKIIRIENGEKKTIKINVNDITAKGEKDKDVTVRPEDIIFVPESFF